MVDYPIQIHEKAQSSFSKERLEAVEYINNNINDFDDIKNVWEDLHRLAQDEDKSVRWSAANALGWAFAFVPEKDKAWEDLHRLTRDEDKSIRLRAVAALGLAFAFVPEKDKAWEDLHLLTQDKDKEVRLRAAAALRSAVAYMPEKDKAREDLRRLSQNKDKEVRGDAADARLMRLPNIFKINNFPLKKLFIYVFAIHATVWGLILSDQVGIAIPFLRPVVTTIFLLSVPGILILRAMRITKFGTLDNLLYAVGLSVAVILGTGLVLDIFTIQLSNFSITYLNMSTYPTLITLTIFDAILMAICYFRSRDIEDEPYHFDVDKRAVLLFLLLLTLPVLTIVGTYEVNVYNNNTLLIAFLFICTAVVFISVTRIIPTTLYPSIIFIMALSLLFHNSLISSYLTGNDIHFEYYFANLVVQNNSWDYSIGSNVNGMLSIVVLAPLFHDISGISLTYIFKVIYPLIFSFVPVTLYQVFKKQTNEKIAILSAFLFISYYIFYTQAGMLSLARQQICELFLSLLLLTLVSNVDNKIKYTMVILFGGSMVTTHYGLSYIFLLLMIGAWAFVLVYNRLFKKLPGTSININYLFIYIAFIIFWYTLVSGSSAFDTIIHIGDNIVAKTLGDVSSSQQSGTEGMSLVTMQMQSPAHDFMKDLHFASQGLIVIGLLYSVVSKRYKINVEYKIFSFIAVGLLAAALVVPMFASSLNTTRLYQIGLITLAPFCVIGIAFFANMLDKIIQLITSRSNVISGMKLAAVFLMIYLLGNSGLIYELTHDPAPGSIAISQQSLKDSGITYENNILYNNINVFEPDVYGSQWLHQYQDAFNFIAVDSNMEYALISYGMFGQSRYTRLLSLKSGTYRNTYVYLGYTNVVENVVRNNFSKSLYMTDFNPYIVNDDMIYTNGGTEIYYIE